jgi:hypothetical protein
MRGQHEEAMVKKWEVNTSSGESFEKEQKWQEKELIP